jgi:putative oxidoreductase
MTNLNTNADDKLNPADFRRLTGRLTNPQLQEIIMSTITLSSAASRPSAPSKLLAAIRASFATNASTSQVLLRLALAVTIFPHGAQKLLGWWGGYGFSGTMGAFTQMMGIPAPLALAAILAEFFGPVLLALGLFTRLSAFAIGTTMIVAAVKVHLAHGFFMPDGIEYFIPVTALAVVLLAKGAGRWSLDSLIARKLDR